MKKLVNKKGFTLIEMLIVVAIVGILVAIAVPTMSSSLDKANAATDAANVRTAESVFAAESADGTKPANGQIFNVSTGKFEAATATNVPANHGKCTAHSAADAPCVIAVVNGEVTWATYAVSGSTYTFTAVDTACTTPAN